MNILFIVENYPPHLGGVEIVFKNTCERLAKLGHTVTVVTHHIRGTKRKERVQEVNIVRVPCLGSRYLFTFIAPLYAFTYARKANIIHTTTYNGAPPAWLVGKLTNTPVIITVHETWIGHWHEYTNMPRWKAKLHDILERPIWWLGFDKYICISQSTKKQLEKVLSKRKRQKIQIIYNGFDYKLWKRTIHKQNAKKLRQKLGLEKKFIVIGTGRPGVSKGFVYLAKAFVQVFEKIPNAHLVLILSRHKEYIKEHVRIREILKHIESHVTYIEPVKYQKLPTFITMADCVVIPSLCEGFGYTTIEANASGTPVVASNVASIPEVISGKYLLVKPRNSEAITQGILAVSKGKYEKKTLKIFSWRKTIASLEKLYNSLRK